MTRISTPSIHDEPEMPKHVSFWNGLGLVIGSMIGSGIFSSPGLVLEASGNAYGTALLVWFVSGLLASSGALCYAELGAMFPVNGGESVYLGKAYGPVLSFMFEFVTIVVQRPGSLAIVCIVLGDHVTRVVSLVAPKLVAMVCVLVLTCVHAVSSNAGIRIQDISTVIKVLTAVVISVVGLAVMFLKKDGMSESSFQNEPFEGIGSMSTGRFAVAFYAGLWAYDGWNTLNYVSGEMKDPYRDLPRVIYFGIPLVIVCYLLANIAYFAVLPVHSVVESTTISIDFGTKLFGTVGGVVFAICVAFSCFGVSANASVFTGARIISVSAKQGHIPSFFGKLHSTRKTPITALILQAFLTLLMILIGSFQELINFYSLSAWIFYFLAVLSVLVLRYMEPTLHRPYRVWLTTPILFCSVAFFLCTTPFIEAPFESTIALCLVLLAIPVWLIYVKFNYILLQCWDYITKRIRGTQGYQEMEMTETQI